MNLHVLRIRESSLFTESCLFVCDLTHFPNDSRQMTNKTSVNRQWWGVQLTNAECRRASGRLSDANSRCACSRCTPKYHHNAELTRRVSEFQLLWLSAGKQSRIVRRSPTFCFGLLWIPIEPQLQLESDRKVSLVSTRGKQIKMMVGRAACWSRLSLHFGLEEKKKEGRRYRTAIINPIILWSPVRCTRLRNGYARQEIIVSTSFI